MNPTASAVMAPRHRAPAWLALAALAGLWLVLIRELGPQWSAFQEYNYGWSVPALAAVLFWRRWKSRPAPAPPAITRGMVITVVCLTLLLLPARLILEANPVWRLFDWLTALAVTGITLAGIYYAGGRGYLRHFCFPVLFVLVAIPWPSSLEIAMVQGLTRMNVRATAAVLNIAGVPALPRGNDLETANGLVGIDEGCSGIRSLQTTLMLALFLGEAYRLGRMARAGLILAGMVFAILCNLTRTVVLAAICARAGPGATEHWHDLTGVTLLLLCFSGEWLAAVWFSGKNPAPVGGSIVDNANAMEFKKRVGGEPLLPRPVRHEQREGRGEGKSLKTLCLRWLNIPIGSPSPGPSRSEDSPKDSCLEPLNLGGPQSIEATEPGCSAAVPAAGSRTVPVRVPLFSPAPSEVSHVLRGEKAGVRGSPFPRLPPTWPLIVLLLWLLGSAIATEAWYHAHESSTQSSPPWTVHWPASQRDYHEAPIDQWTRSVLKYGEGGSARWAGDGPAQWQGFYFRWLPTTSARGRVEMLHADTHRPEICLPATGMTLRREFGTVEFKGRRTTLAFAKYAFEDRGLPLYVYRCVLLERNQELVSGDLLDDRRTRLRSVWAGQRRLGQRLLEMAVWGIADDHAADQEMEAQLREIISPY